MIVSITDEADADLESIGDFIARDNPARAVSFVAELLAACHFLATMPRAFPLVPPYEDSGVRRRPYRDYVIFYSVGDDAVQILHVLHGSRDYEAVLFPQD